MSNLLNNLSLGVHAMGASPADVIGVGQRLERLGWNGISVGDSALDSLCTLSGVAASTSRIQLRSGVALWSRTPVQTVFGAATIDQLSGGRYRLGLGPGSRERSTGWHNVDYAKPVARFRDFVTAVRTAWHTEPGKPIAYEGPYFAFRNWAVVRPQHTVDLPIDLAANQPQMLRLAGMLGDGVMFNDLHTGSYLRNVALPEVAEGERRAGRPVGSVRRIGGFLVSLGRTREAAMDRARDGLQAYLSIGHNREILHHYGLDAARAKIEASLAAGDPAGVRASIGEDVINALAICGDADFCRARIAEHDDVLDEAILHISEWRVPGGAAVAAYEELTEELAPR